MPDKIGQGFRTLQTDRATGGARRGLDGSRRQDVCRRSHKLSRYRDFPCRYRPTADCADFTLRQISALSSAVFPSSVRLHKLSVLTSSDKSQEYGDKTRGQLFGFLNVRFGIEMLFVRQI